jgi:ferredoxin-thioredoxin reductase catalytic subunit
MFLQFWRVLFWSKFVDMLSSHAHGLNWSLLMPMPRTGLFSCPCRELVSSRAHAVNWSHLMPMPRTGLFSCACRELISAHAHAVNWSLLMRMPWTGLFSCPCRELVFSHAHAVNWSLPLAISRMWKMYPLHVIIRLHTVALFLKWPAVKHKQMLPNASKWYLSIES